MNAHKAMIAAFVLAAAGAHANYGETSKTSSGAGDASSNDSMQSQASSDSVRDAQQALKDKGYDVVGWSK